MVAFEANVAPLLAPKTPAGLARFVDVGSAHQDVVLLSSLPAVTPEGFEAFVAALDSEWTKTLAVRTACSITSDPELDPQTVTAFSSVLNDLLAVPPPAFSLEVIENGGYTDCTSFDPVTTFADDWAKLKTGLPSGGINHTRLSFLTAFEIPAPLALSTWGSVAKQSNSPTARWLSTLRLRSYAPRLDPADVPAFRAFFVDLLHTTEITAVLHQAIRALVMMAAPSEAETTDILDGLRAVLHSPWTKTAHRRAACGAFFLTEGDAAAWQAFVDAQSDAPLSVEAAAILQDPDLCQ